MSHDAEAHTPAEQDIDTIRRQAADWIVWLDRAGPEDRERLENECAAWQAADPRRERVLAQMRRMWSATEPGGTSRRKATTFGVLALLGALLAAQLPWNVWTADHRTAPGEIREIVLPDGSAVVLNTDSAIDFDERTRTLDLERGELLVTVADEPGRAFHVQTNHGSATALGTRYGVRLEPDHARVTVHESRVRLEPARAGERAITLDAGQRARLSADRVSSPESVDPDLPDWVDRQLVFNDVALEDVVERLRRYRRGWLLLDEDLSGTQLRFTGVLPADDSDAALKLLAESLALEVERTTPYLARIRPRD